MTIQMSNPTIRRVSGIMFAAVIGTSAIVSLTAPAQAIDVTSEQREFCMGDAFRLCSSEIPDVDRVLVCMRAKKSQVSSQCRAVMPR